MSARRAHDPLTRSMRLTLLFVTILPASFAYSQDLTKSCTDAAQVLVNASTGVRVANQARSSTAGERTLPWTSDSGHAGECRFDSAGRLYVTARPWAGTSTSYPSPIGKTSNASRCQRSICFMPSTMALVPSSGVRPEGPWMRSGV